MSKSTSTNPVVEASASHKLSSKNTIVKMKENPPWQMARNAAVMLDTSFGAPRTTSGKNTSNARKKIKKLLTKTSERGLNKMEMLRRPAEASARKRGEIALDSELSISDEDFRHKRRVVAVVNRKRVHDLISYAKKCIEKTQKKRTEHSRINFQPYIDKFILRDRIATMGGRERLALIERLIRMFLPRMWKMQLRFINALNCANLRKILGPEFETEGPKICQERGWDITMALLLIVLAARRAGKSTAAAAALAAYLIAIPNFKIFNVAGGFAMAQELLSIVAHFVKSYHDAAKRIHTNARRVTLKNQEGPGESKMQALATNGKGEAVRNFTFFSVCAPLTMCSPYACCVMNAKEYVVLCIRMPMLSRIRCPRQPRAI